MLYADIDNTYLKRAIDRIKGGLEEVSKLPVLLNPLPEEKQKTLESYWAVGATLMQETEQASDLSTQIWSVASMLIWKVDQEKYDATIYSGMYSLVPKCFNFMRAHKRLIFNAEQVTQPIPYLDPSGVRVVLNSLNEDGPGFSIIHRLPFDLHIEEEW
jgi:hypothetical protein